MSKVFIPALTMGCDAHRPVSAKVPFIPPLPSFPPLRESRGVAKTTVTGLLRFCGTLPGTHGWIDPTQKEHPKMFQQSLMSHVSKYNKIFCDSAAYAAYAKYHFYFFNGRPPFTLSTIHWASSTLAALYSLKMGPCRNMHLYP